MARQMQAVSSLGQLHCMKGAGQSLSAAALCVDQKPSAQRRDAQHRALRPRLRMQATCEPQIAFGIPPAMQDAQVGEIPRGSYGVVPESGQVVDPRSAA
jgi:hypothetical protein